MFKNYVIKLKLTGKISSTLFFSSFTIQTFFDSLNMQTRTECIVLTSVGTRVSIITIKLFLIIIVSKVRKTNIHFPLLSEKHLKIFKRKHKRGNKV